MTPRITAVGHPVDVATGAVFSTHEDIRIPGAVALTWERRYDTTLLSAPPTPLGAGWTTRYFTRLRDHGSEYHFLSPDGALLVFPDPGRRVPWGATVRDPGTFYELTSVAGHFFVTHWDVETCEIVRYVFQAGRRGEAWPLSSIEDVTGTGLDLFHDQDGRLQAIRQRLEQRHLALAYNGAGRIVSITAVGPAGHQQTLVGYEYDADGRLINARDALGNPERYQYDPAGRMVREIARDGGVFSFQYDAKGRCIRTSGLDRYDEKTLRFIDATRTTYVTDSYGHTTQYQYLATGQVTNIWDALGGETRTEYDEHGRVIAETSPTGATTRFEFDAQGNRSRVIDPLGNAITQDFNDAHQPTGLTDPEGNVWKREYDRANRLVATMDANGSRWLIGYDADGSASEFVNPLGHRCFHRFVRGVLAEISDHRGNVTQLETDFLGRVVRRVGPLGASFDVTYDALGNPLRVAFADGSVIQASFDSGSNLARLVDGRGFETRYRYGPCRRLLERTDPNGNRVRFEWGTEPGRLEKLINAKGEIYSFVYDAAGRAISETSFDGRVYSFRYDLDGWCIGVTNGSGEVVEITRDPLGRLIDQRLSDGGFMKIRYDRLGRFVEAVNEDGAVTVKRDAVGRVVEETQGDHWIRLSYDVVGNRTRMETSLGHFVDYVVDEDGRPTRLTTTHDRAILFLWDAAGNQVIRDLPGNVVLAQGYDVLGRLVEQWAGGHTPGSTPGALSTSTLVQRSYVLDSAAYPTRITDSQRGVTDYTYDPGARLLQAVHDGRLAEVFEYDSTDNLTRIGSLGEFAGVETLEYGAGDRLLRRDATTFEYDAQGRLLKKTDGTETWTYAWDALDQLRSVTRPDGAVWEYKYDALGRRTSKKGPNGTTFFIWDGDVLANEVSAEKRNWTGWVFSPSDFTPLAKTEGEEFFSIISDHLGTPQEMVDAGGRVVWRAQRRAYGTAMQDEGGEISNPFRFQGQYYDAESGLHYNRFRYYDPGCGRFIQQDPLGLVGAENLYKYVPNPIAWIDPFGLAECHKSGERGTKAAEKDLKAAGFKIIGKEVTMYVGNPPVRIRADFVAVGPNKQTYVFEVKNGTGRLTDNQTASGVFDISNPANKNGGISMGGGSGTKGSFEVATDNRAGVGARGDTKDANFAVLKYDK